MGEPVTRPKAVVLLSGGLDSATVLAIAQSEGYETHALTIAYGQRHAVELRSAERVAKAIGAHSHKVVELPLTAWGGSALTDSIDVPKGRDDDQISSEIPVTYVPARNTIFLSLALGYAEVIGANTIFVGVNAVDYSGYPDCRPEFIDAFEKLANVATKAGVEGQKMSIRAPLIDLTKTQIIEWGQRLGVDYGLTHSCYDPVGPDGAPCGECDSCHIRLAAFRALGQDDPAMERPIA
jgi:7-cyano-7-deazaguanine synthase